MSLLLSTGLLVGTLVFSCILYAVFQHLASPLRSIPGPFLARFTDLWYLRKVYEGNYEEQSQLLHKYYDSPIVRYGPNRYSISHPDGLKIYRPGAEFPKSSWYDAWSKPGTVTNFNDRDTRRHNAARKLYSSPYAMSSLLSYEPYVTECIDIFRQRLTELAQTGLVVNLHHWLQCYAFDLIGLMTFSERFGFLDRGDDVGGVMKAIDESLAYGSHVGIFPSLHPLLFLLRQWSAGKQGSGRAYIMSFTSSMISKHIKNSKSSTPLPDSTGEARANGFLEKFLGKQAQDERFTTDHVFHGCMQNIFAGSDTTGSTLSCIMYLLLKHPQVLDRLRKEVDSRPGALTFTRTQDMPYLQAVIKESMRLFPVIGLPLERVVPSGGASIAGTSFPSGTIVGVHPWVELRNSDYFGDDAGSFRPERWLTEDSEEISRMNRHWVPFGLGSRTCIGRHISMLEMSKLIPELVRHFDFELDEELARPGSSWTTRNRWFIKPLDFNVRVKAKKD
ncbi:cytochrome P450 [Xylariomycetidae sp. FL2044]|nr:cytochrome P450 [Xylariomycetidae sp. FL2044]